MSVVMIISDMMMTVMFKTELRKIRFVIVNESYIIGVLLKVIKLMLLLMNTAGLIEAYKV